MTRTSRERLTWAKIREHHWDEWVLLADVEEDADRAIRFARVLDHDESMIEIMDRNEPFETPLLAGARP